MTNHTATLRHDWQPDEVAALFSLPFTELMYQAQMLHRQHHDPNRVQVSTLLSIKTGGCPEDCGYCPQSAHHNTDVASQALMRLDEVLSAAHLAKAEGATRFCMGAAWRAPKGRDFKRVCDMVREIKAMGLETCVTLGMLSQEQSQQLKSAGLDYYNHNLDTSAGFYEEVITTHDYQARLDTLTHVRQAGIKVCCGGIVGMGEQREDRCELLRTLANLPQHPESVPINLLVRIPGTPLANTPVLEPLEFVRSIAVARILMPASMVRLSAGREGMSDELQALCFLAGANSIFYGEKLLTTSNVAADADRDLFDRLGLKAMAAEPKRAGTKA